MMNRKFWVTGVALVTGVLLSGCSGSTPMAQPGFTASKPLPTSAATASTASESDRCAATVNVIGLGNPGNSGKDENVSAAYDALRSKLLSQQENDPQGITDQKVTLTIPTYNGDNEQLSSRIDDISRNYNGEDGYYPKSQTASKSLVDAMDLSGKTCPGSHVVLIGYDFGASAIRYAMHSLTPEQSSRISGIWLIRDPNRSNLDNDKTPTFNGDLSAPIVADTSAGGTLKFSGIRGGGSDFDGAQKNKVLIVCFPDDLECNTDMDFVWHTDKFIASHGGSVAALHNLKKQYMTPEVVITAADWIAPLVQKDVTTAMASKANAATSDNQLQKYLDYVNGDAPGAQVVQDAAKNPDIITTCDADYAVIGLRGSGENIDGTMNDTNGNKLTPIPIDGVTYYGGSPAQGGPIIEGFPEFLATSAWQIKTTLPSDKKIRFIPVEYAAVPINIDPLYLPTFLDSATQGSLLLENKILEVESKCPNTKIVLMGYSQGAQSVHEALHGTDEEHAKNIAAVIFISDPLRRGNDPATLSYDPLTYPNQFATSKSPLFSTSGISINEAAQNALKINPTTYAIPAFFQGKVVEICDLKDVVCNGDAIVDMAGALLSPSNRNVWITHATVYRYNDHYVFPATWAAQKLLNSSNH